MGQTQHSNLTQNTELTRFIRTRERLSQDIAEAREYLEALLRVEKEMQVWEKDLFVRLENPAAS